MKYVIMVIFNFIIVVAVFCLLTLFVTGDIFFYFSDKGLVVRFVSVVLYIMFLIFNPVLEIEGELLTKEYNLLVSWLKKEK